MTVVSALVVPDVAQFTRARRDQLRISVWSSSDHISLPEWDFHIDDGVSLYVATLPYRGEVTPHSDVVRKLWGNYGGESTTETVGAGPAIVSSRATREPVPGAAGDSVAYATELAEWNRQQRQAELDRRRAGEAIVEDELEALEDREISTDPDDYDNVPEGGAYITIETTKRTAEKDYRYRYWQWREGDTWKNEYIAPVNPGETS